VELANLNRPLLKRLAAETPGTFQHTLAVANLAEAAGRELGCNIELIRTGTLYHDIGKMHDPLAFIENQMGRDNKHIEIDDPWASAIIIRKHVTEGSVMARRAGLPTAVRRFIPEHQGAQLISYFHHQALQRQRQDPTIVVQDSDFRYAGPNPQSRETAIVMLADSCEAALRSLHNASPEIAANMIQKIFRARWQDGVLAESGLHRQDLDPIAEAFLQVWQQTNHQRIAYPS
jgi:cyclic-di-AMP phosphodiesterase PgpH